MLRVFMGAARVYGRYFVSGCCVCFWVALRFWVAVRSFLAVRAPKNATPPRRAPNYSHSVGIPAAPLGRRRFVRGDGFHEESGEGDSILVGEGIESGQAGAEADVELLA